MTRRRTVLYAAQGTLQNDAEIDGFAKTRSPAAGDDITC